MGNIVLDAMKVAVEKVGTAVLNTVAQTLSGAVNELKTAIDTINSKIPSNASSSNKLVVNNDSRLSDSRNAKDVYAWAKASSKPSYNYNEIKGTFTIRTVTVPLIYSCSVPTGLSSDFVAISRANWDSIVLNSGTYSDAIPLNGRFYYSNTPTSPFAFLSRELKDNGWSGAYVVHGASSAYTATKIQLTVLCLKS